ncbi:MAG: tail fiber domain-containing protein [Bdellovibrio sp.]
MRSDQFGLKFMRKVKFLIRRLFFSIVGLLFVFSFNSYSLAAPTSLTYQGRILKSDGTPLEYNNVSFIFQITDPSGQCVIYQEQVNGINMANSAGVFDVPIGNGTIQYPLGGTTTILDVFNNSASFTCGSCSSTNGNYTCTNGSGVYAASATDVRKLRVSFYDGTGWKLITPDNTVRSVPFAGYALSAQKLGTHVETDFLFKAGLPTCSAGTFLSYDGTSLTCVPVAGASGGTVTNVTSANSYLTVANNTSAPVLTLNVGTVANTVAAGNDPRLSDSRTPMGAAGGVLNGTYPNPGFVDSSVTNTKINDGAVSTSKLFANPGVNRLVATDSTTGSTLAAMTCAAGQLLTWNIVSGWQCSAQSSLAVGSATVSGSATNFTGNLVGDVSGTQAATSVDKIKGVPLDFSIAPTNGQVLKFNGTNWAPAADSNAGGTVTNVSSANADIGVANGSSTPVLTLNSGTAANQIIKLDASAKLPAVDASQLTNLQASQIPNLDAAKITTGTLPVARGGTGQSTYSDGQLLIGNTATSGLSKATLTAGSGVTITNGNGSISISATGTGGTVTNVTGTAPVSVVTGTSTPVVSLTNGTTAGQVYRWDGTSSWAATKLKYTDLINVSSGSPWPTTSCSAGQAVTWSSVSDSFDCTTLSIATSQLTGTLAAAQMPAFTGDVSSTAGSLALTLANSGVTAGTYNSVTVDAKGRVTAGSNPTTLAGYGITDAIKNLGGTPGMQTGLDASKPASPSAGTIYFATDTFKIYQYNSGAWSMIASASGSGGTVTGITAGTGLTGGTITATGTIGLGTELTGLNGLATTGFVKRTGPGAYSTAASVSLTADISGTLPIANGGTGLTTTPTNGQLLIGNGTGYALGTMSGDATMSSTGAVTIASGAVSNSKMANMAAGTLKGNTTGTSATPSDLTIASLQGTTSSTFAAGNDSRITGSLQTSGGTMTGMLTLATGTASLSPLRLPSGTLVTTPVAGNLESDGSNLYWTDSTATRQKLAYYTGTPTNGQLLIGNGTEFSVANLTAGSGATITNSAGGITISATGTGISDLTGDVTAGGTGSVAATVASVGGSSAANVHTAEVAVNSNATSASTASALVKRDASGTASFKSVKLDGATSGTLTQTVPAAVTSYSVTWPSSVAGLANSVLASDTTGNLSWINLGSVAGTINLTSQVTGVLPIANGGTNSSTALTNNQLMVSNAGAIKELGAMTDGQIVVGKSAASPQIVAMNGDVTITNTGATTIGKINGTTVTGVGLANNNILQNISGAAITANNVLVSNGTGTGVTALSSPASGVLISSGSIPTWSSLTSDNFTQYALLAGRSGGQTLNGGTAASENLTLSSTSNATKGNVFINPSGGNVGIGTTTPGTTLDIRYPSATNGVSSTILNAGVGTDATLGPLYFQIWGNPSATGTSRYMGIDAGDSISVRSLILNMAPNGVTGNVGIGTTSPSGLLQVAGVSYFGINGTSFPTLGTTNGIVGGATNSGGSFELAMSGGNTGAIVRVGTSSNASYLQSDSTIPLTLRTNGAERMRIDSSGNVGIGTTTPNAKLDVANGTIRALDSATQFYPTSGKGIEMFSLSGVGYIFEYDRGTSTYGNLSLNGNVGIGTAAPAAPLEIPGIGTYGQSNWYRGIRLGNATALFWASGTSYSYSLGQSGNVLYFGRATSETGGAGTQTYDMVLNSGLVGIGTPSPTALLHVNGSALATAWNTSSDIRLKEHISEIENPLEKILSLRGVEFDWRKDIEQPTQHKQTHDIGVIAQEVEKQFPEAVTTAKDGYKSVAYAKLVSPIIGAIKNLYNRIRGIEDQQTTQARQIASLKKQTDSKVDKTEFEVLKMENSQLKAEVDKAKKENAEIKARLERLEKAMGGK